METFSNAVYDHKRAVMSEVHFLQDKVRALRVVGMDILANEIAKCCDEIEGDTEDLRIKWGNHVTGECDRINNSIGETLKAFADTLPSDKKGA